MYKQTIITKLIAIPAIFIICCIATALYAEDSNTYIRAENPIDPQELDLNYWPTQIEKLEAAYQKDPKDKKIINSLSNAYNNYGVLLAKHKRWDLAKSYVEQAIRLSTNPTPLKKNLSNIYYAQAKDLYDNRNNLNTYTSYNAKQLVNKAISYDSNNVNANLLLGDIEYIEQNMLAAERAWKKAASLVPNNANVQKRLEQIQRETNAETDMNTVFNARFNIKIDAAVAANPYFDINKILNTAYDKVAPDFQYPRHQKVPVVVYNREEYKQTLVDAPAWAEAAFDQKIRIAIKPDQQDFRQLQSDIIHEYTHFIITKLTGGNIPRWFNEGIAKYEEYKHGIPPRIYLLAIAYNTEQIISWDYIDKALVSRNKEVALLAYQQSFSFVFYLVQKYGMPKVINVLKLLGKDKKFEDAIQETYGVSLTTLQKNWRQWLTYFITNWANSPATSGVDYAY